MANILVTSDFSGGEYKVPQNCFDSVQDYIDKYEKHYLVRLLGAELYDLFVADLVAGVPQSARFVAIFNEFRIDESKRLYISEGLKQMLIQFCYFHIVRDLGVKKGIGGVGKYQSEVGTESYLGFNIVEAYNEGVDNWRIIQWYICDNDADYIEFNGDHINYISGI